jgi:tetratricopeptide (TPR) repeat protein
MKRYLKYTLIVGILLSLTGNLDAQRSIFDDEEVVTLVKKAADHIYGMNEDSAQYYVDRVTAKLPNHPIVPMMEAVRVLWTNIPVLQDSIFDRFNNYLLATVSSAQSLPANHPDAIFFEMSARGLLAEYYADRGAYMKALNEATRAYALLKDGMKLTDKYPEFLFAVGLYNYFREAYPEKHPIYKPLVWFFLEGDKELGLKQLKQATKDAIIIRVEAYVYLTYIYMRYEEKPEQSRKYIAELLQFFPKNPYVNAKYLEAHYSSGKLEFLQPEIMDRLKESDKPYYKLVGHLYNGIRLELIEKSLESAQNEYLKADELSQLLPGYASYYKSLVHLGLGRIHIKKGDRDTGRTELELALSFAETEDVKSEVDKWMKQ